MPGYSQERLPGEIVTGPGLDMQLRSRWKRKRKARQRARGSAFQAAREGACRQGSKTRLEIPLPMTTAHKPQLSHRQNGAALWRAATRMKTITPVKVPAKIRLPSREPGEKESELCVQAGTLDILSIPYGGF